MTESVSFDRAAGYYDRTRSLPSALMARLVTMLAQEIGGSGQCLEVGVGTGRIAVPLSQAGVPIVGIDISRAMLEQLRHKSLGEPLRVVIADATRLPFPDRSFDSAIAAHVLHLIPAWREAVGELLRVVRAGGTLLAARGGQVKESWRHDVRRHFFVAAGDPPWPPGVDTVEEIDEHMRARGARVRALPELVEEGEQTAGGLIDNLEAGLWSACWSLDEATRRRAAASTRAWAEQNVGDLEEARPVTEFLIWRAYDLP